MKYEGTVDLLTRVEGHGTVELVQDGGRVVAARLNLHESPRLFEALLVGRRCDEVAEIACRICSICSTVHKVAALQGVEQAMGLQISRQTGLLRQLAVQGGQMESHALHIFCLALPDYLGVGGFPGLALAAPRELEIGLRIKAVGNLIQEVIGGRAIHPFNLRLGGIGKVPAVDQLKLLDDKLSGVLDDLVEAITLVSGLPELLPVLPPIPGVAVSGGPSLFGDHLATTGGDLVPASSAAAWLNEKIVAHSHAKVSCFNGGNIFMVGPLARLRLSLPPGYEARLAGASMGASLLARVLELQSAVKRAMELVSQLLVEGVKGEEPVRVTFGVGAGTGLLEAPRGLLLHSYRFDSRGICTGADIITPTAINQGAMELSLNGLVSAMDGAGYDQVRKTCELLIRCFDPCISCAVH